MTGWQIMFFAMVAFIGLVMLAAYLNEKNQRQENRLETAVSVVFGGCVTLAARLWWVGVIVAFGLVSFNAWASEPADTINAITDELDAGHAGIGGITASLIYFLREKEKRFFTVLDKISNKVKELDEKLDRQSVKIAALETHITHLIDKK